MESAWIGLFGVLIGAGIGFCGNYLKMRHDDKAEKRRLFLQKLEAIYRQVSTYHDLNTKFHLGFKYNFYGSSDGKDVRDQTKQVDLTEISLLINFYAPELKEFFDHFSGCVAEYLKTTLQLGNLQSSGKNVDDDLMVKLEKAYELLRKSFHLFEKSITAMSRRFTDVTNR